MPAEEYGAKYRTKPEIFHFLAHDVGAYLSSYDTMTWMHLRDLQSGKKKIIKGTEMKHMHVPQYDHLTIE